jgi:hypothetical protein
VCEAAAPTLDDVQVMGTNFCTAALAGRARRLQTPSMVTLTEPEWSSYATRTHAAEDG